MQKNEIVFAYDEPALILHADKNYLAIGDLHIGKERELENKGVYAAPAVSQMLNRINKLIKDFSIKKVIFLGDIKDAILNPDSRDIKVLKDFFDSIQCSDFVIIRGNHDANLPKLLPNLKERIYNELIVAKTAFMHGNRWPSNEAMMADYIISAHTHFAISIKKEKYVYKEKVWVKSVLDANIAEKYYKKFNSKIEMVSMPPFNDLILGKPMKKEYDGSNPVFTSGVFDYLNAEVYDLKGNFIGSVKKICL
ncbi:MAG: metallophosphoesterase [Candidatus Micrarchaeia archaeon]